MEEKEVSSKTDKLQRRLFLLLGVLVLVTLMYNVTACWRIYRQAPLREAASRSLMAANSRFFYDSGLVEPLPVFALKVPMLLGADPDTAVRIEGLLLFGLITGFTFLILRRLYGVTAGLMAAALVAGNPYFGIYAMQGSSLLFALLFLLLFWNYADPDRLNARRALAAGIFGGLACLSRMDSVWFLMLHTFFFLFIKRRNFNFRAAALALGAAFLLLLPYLAWQKAQYGNSLYAQELSLRRWANTDSRSRFPGLPLLREPLSVPGFLLRDGAAGAVTGFFKGLGRGLSYELPKAVYYKFILVFAFLGFYASFISRRDALPVFFASALLPVMFLAGISVVRATGGIALCYFLAGAWAVCAAAGLGLQEAAGWSEAWLLKWIKTRTEEYSKNGKK